MRCPRCTTGFWTESDYPHEDMYCLNCGHCTYLQKLPQEEAEILVRRDAAAMADRDLSPSAHRRRGEVKTHLNPWVDAVYGERVYRPPARRSQGGG